MGGSAVRLLGSSADLSHVQSIIGLGLYATFRPTLNGGACIERGALLHGERETTICGGAQGTEEMIQLGAQAKSGAARLA